MKLARRVFLAFGAGGAALTALPRFASALDYPTRPVHIVVGFAAGLSPDILGRMIAQALLRAAQSAIHRRQPARSGKQYRH